MTYKEKLVVVVKCNGKILRERDGFVTLPFGSEYSVLFKNLDSRKAIVKVAIDGRNVLENGLILHPNSDSEIEGFLEGNQVKNRFKFIQKTQEIIDYRGDRVDDGMIRIEFQHEKIIEHRTIVHDHVHHDHYHYRDWWSYPYPHYPYYPPSPMWTCSMDVAQRGSSSDTVSCASNSVSLNSISLPLQDEGITVKGSEANQIFNYGHIGDLDSPEVIIIRLRGIKEDGQQIEKPIFVKDKLSCETCGRKSESSVKFCSGCGTALGI